MKTCFKCGIDKPLAEFYKHPRMDDGHLGKCKVCARKDVRENRERRRAYYNEYDRKRMRRPERRKGIRLSQKKWGERHRARVLLQNAVTRGKIVKPSACEECGMVARIDGHHADYTKPLEVAWLCRPCHMRHHRIEAAA